jgi:hypothetical protein
MQALEAIRTHMQLNDTAPFDAAAVERVQGFNGAYDTALAPSEAKAVQQLRKAYAKSLHDLDMLLMENGLDLNFPGLAPEL